MNDILSAVFCNPYLTVIALVIGFVALIYGADWLVDGASGMAKRFGVSNLVIGLTVVAFGTSMPEFVVSMLAAINHNTELAITNVLGSNSINTFVVLGCTALLCPVMSQRSSRLFDIPWSLLAGILVLGFVLSFGCLNRVAGIVLLVLFAVFLWHSVRTAKAQDDTEDYAPMAVWKALLLMAVGLMGLVLGGELIVQSATSIAHSLGVSDAIIGLTVVALGTSLPELATSCIAALKKNSDLALGNVIGSNIFNVYMILGVGATISPLPAYDGLVLDALMVCLSSLMVMVFVAWGKHRISRVEGGLLVLTYAAYLAYRLLTL